jgi:hypothetical protein
MHYPTDHDDLLPSGLAPLPMPDTRLEALWLLLCLEERRRMLPCPDGPLGGAGRPGPERCFRAADHAQQVRLGAKGNFDS